jgi:hypothetical protein
VRAGEALKVARHDRQQLAQRCAVRLEVTSTAASAS